ncbi:cytochrome P450 [Allokutzneria sp. A3M-2-11 16]|uniref:cytochrome P450 n=1 Tax=Allokutzneria sp. A3M-2-11 16 TaxID=2962043 RepID=UPI0020B8708C|nr:cytochrome P450 [Allokutzneria sp. A3M-2-11 16]MCP3802110.1 cytochrome P450 [Allokutzneria sp. A3M-2-11 16]
MNTLRIGAQVGAAKATTRLFAAFGDLFAQLERPRWLEDPYPLYERIRAKGPVYRAPSGIRTVSSFALCNQVLRDPTEPWSARRSAEFVRCAKPRS